MTKPGEEEELLAHVHSKGYKDYKGLNWILVVEQETKEIFAQVIELRNIVIVISITLILFTFLIGVLISYSILKPLDKLTKGTEIIGKGNLKHTIDIKSKDEFGILTDSFNQMAKQLREHDKITQKEISVKTKQLRNVNLMLEEKVKERTKELQKAKDELDKKVEERTNNLKNTTDDLKKTKQELENKNKELEETLEDFYTMRIGMQKDLKLGRVEEENKKIKKRLDKLKKSK
jgi:nitrate/nitrite-specific signal transduction histidine kinase